MALLNGKVTAETRQILAELSHPVRMNMFAKDGCDLCGPVTELAREVAALSPQLQLETRDLAADGELAGRLGVARAPALALTRPGDARAPVCYHGMPSGHEFGAFLRTLILLSTGRGTPGVDQAAVAAITRPTSLKVFVLAS